MTTDTKNFEFSRDFPLPPARMWSLLTAPEFREIWGAPEEGKNLEQLHSDVSVGGLERHRSGPEDAPDFEVETRWYQLAEPDQAVYTEVIEAGGARLGASLVTIQVAEAGTGSSVSITVAVSSFVGAEMIGEFENSWNGSMAKIAALAEQQAA